MFKFLSNADKQNFILSAGTKGQGEGLSKEGIVAGHAYSMISVYELSNKDRVVKMRNPWGKTEYTGKYAEDS